MRQTAPETHLHLCSPKYQEKKKNQTLFCLTVILSHGNKALLNGRGLTTASARCDHSRTILHPALNVAAPFAESTLIMDYSAKTTN